MLYIKVKDLEYKADKIYSLLVSGELTLKVGNLLRVKDKLTQLSTNYSSLIENAIKVLDSKQDLVSDLRKKEKSSALLLEKYFYHDYIKEELNVITALEKELEVLTSRFNAIQRLHTYIEQEILKDNPYELTMSKRDFLYTVLEADTAKEKELLEQIKNENKW